jgi:hypothetical protein
MATGWCVEPDSLVVLGHGEAEAVPAGLVELVPQGVGVFDDAPHAGRAPFADLVHAAVVGEGDLCPGAVVYRDRGGGGFPVLEAAVAQRDVGTEVEAGQKPHDQRRPRGAWVQGGGAGYRRRVSAVSSFIPPPVLRPQKDWPDDPDLTVYRAIRSSMQELHYFRM